MTDNTSTENTSTENNYLIWKYVIDINDNSTQPNIQCNCFLCKHTSPEIEIQYLKYKTNIQSFEELIQDKPKKKQYQLQKQREDDLMCKISFEEETIDEAFYNCRDISTCISSDSYGKDNVFIYKEFKKTINIDLFKEMKHVMRSLIILMLLKYENLAARKHHYFLSSDIFINIIDVVNANTHVIEGFGSPLSNTFTSSTTYLQKSWYSSAIRYCSIFSQTDYIFGSKGNLWTQPLGRFADEVVYLFPPCLPEILDRTIQLIISIRGLCKSVIFVCPQSLDITAITNVYKNVTEIPYDNIVYFYDYNGEKKSTKSDIPLVITWLSRAQPSS